MRFWKASIRHTNGVRAAVVKDPTRTLRPLPHFALVSNRRCQPRLRPFSLSEIRISDVSVRPGSNVVLLAVEQLTLSWDLVQLLASFVLGNLG